VAPRCRLLTVVVVEAVVVVVLQVFFVICVASFEDSIRTVGACKLGKRLGQ